MNLHEWVEREEEKISREIDEGILTSQQGRNAFKRLYEKAREYGWLEGQTQQYDETDEWR